MDSPIKDIATDIAILGGGLAGGLIALALNARRPELSVKLIERDHRFGGHHIWSFFASDVAAQNAWLVEPLITARWDGYSVRFPGRERELNTAYRSMTGENLDAVLRARLPADALMTGVEVRDTTPTSVTLADGRQIVAGGVIDARGSSALPHMHGGWQKFAGQILKLAAPHGLKRPIVMDARVEQLDGYRFVYCLPFSDTEVFVEDTYYADGPELDLPALRRNIAEYAQARGWQVEAVAYEETGVLPVIAAGDFEAFWQAEDPAMAKAGTRAALGHPLTSYSVPVAVSFAMHLCALDNLSGEGLGRAAYSWAQDHWRRGRFYRMLTRMLFGAAVPNQRYRVLERFYGLPEPLIQRFYAGRSTPADMARILAGKPPVPLGAAMASLLGHGRPLASLGGMT